MNDLTLHEKTAIGSLVAVAVAAWIYFPDALLLQSRDDATPADLGLALLGATIVLVIIEIAYHAIVARGDDGSRRDERDRAVRDRARSLSALVLEVGVIGVLLHIVFGSLWAAPDVQVLMIVNWLVGLLFLAEAVEQGATLWFYRRGA